MKKIYTILVLLLATHYLYLLYTTYTPDRYEQQEAIDFPIPVEGRSSKWSSIRSTHLDKYPICEICGSSDRLNVHHIIPYSVCPQLELEPRNLVTLCFEHHLKDGHKGSWKKYDPHILMKTTSLR